MPVNRPMPSPGSKTASPPSGYYAWHRPRRSTMPSGTMCLTNVSVTPGAEGRPVRTLAVTAAAGFAARTLLG